MAHSDAGMPGDEAQERYVLQMALRGVGAPAYNRFLLQFSAGEAGLCATTLPLVRQWLHDGFLQLCAAQGFDWKRAWNGRFLQEFDLTPLRGAGG
jgi:hypothetical protein